MASDESDARDEIIKRVMGRVPEVASTPFSELTREMLATVWGRPLLSIRERRLIVLAVLAMTSAPIEMETHLRAALRTGDLTAEEIDEFCFQLAMYGGWPRAARTQAILAQIRNEPEGA